MAEEALHLDFTGTQLSLEAAEAGTYPARVFDVKIGPSKSSGNPNIFWTFELQEEPYEGRKIFYNTSLLPQSLWNVARTLKALGWTDEELSAPGGLDLDPDDLLDLGCLLVLIQDSYQGEVRNKVQRVLPLEEPSPAELTAQADGIDPEDTTQEEFAIPF